MTSAVKAVNEAYPSSQHLRQVRKGSGATQVNSYEKLAPGLNQSFALLARVDFYRSLTAAQALERKPLSVLASLAVCRAILVSPTQPQNKGKVTNQ